LILGVLGQEALLMGNTKHWCGKKVPPLKLSCQCRKGTRISPLFLSTIEVSIEGHKPRKVFRGAIGEGFFDKIA
jgi:hypothetical protein